jgi:ComF family protein
MQPIGGRVCSICAERVLSSYAEPDSDNLIRCPVCRRIAHPFTRAVAYGSYEGGLRELIHLLKYSGVRPAAGVLGRMIASCLTQLESEFEDEEILIVPVPVYKGKRRQRGFNQAETIAREAMRFYPEQARFALANGVLLRVRDTQSQIGLTSHQRRENMRGAFAVSDGPAIAGRSIVVVDDVYTTGTTLSECARVLQKAGATRVWAATVARTLKHASKYEDSSIPTVHSFKKDAESLDEQELEDLETVKL